MRSAFAALLITVSIAGASAQQTPGADPSKDSQNRTGRTAIPEKDGKAPSARAPRFGREFCGDVADVAKARTWLGSDEMKATMQKSGVVGSPHFRFVAAA